MSSFIVFNWVVEFTRYAGEDHALIWPIRLKVMMIAFRQARRFINLVIHFIPAVDEHNDN